MSILLDGLGQWSNLGTLTPSYANWQSFPTPATQGFTTFRVSFTGEWFVGGWHWIYLKEAYQTSGDKVDGRWLRVYPDSTPKIVYIYNSPEFGYLNPQRSFEILKSHKYIRTYGGRFTDKVFSVKLEEFSPYPELIATAQEQTLKAEIIEQIAQRVVQLLPPSIS